MFQPNSTISAPASASQHPAADLIQSSKDSTTPSEKEAAIYWQNRVKRPPSYHTFLNSLHEKVEAVDLSSLQGLFDQVMSGFSEEGTMLSISLLSLFYRMYKLETFGDLFFAAVDFLKSVFSPTQLKNAARAGYKLVRSSITELYNKLLLLSPSTESAVVDVLKNIKKNMSMVLNSEIVTSIRDFVLSLVSFKVFSKDSTRRITSTLGPAKPCNGLDLVEVCLSAAVSVLTFSESLSKGVPLNDVFCSKDPISSFVSTVSEIEVLQTMTYSGLPVEGKVCRRAYLDRVVKAIRSGETLKDSLPRNAPQMKTIENNLRTVRLIKADFMNRMHAESRPTPYCICLNGLPGTGKGLLIDVLAMVWARCKGREYSPSQTYHRQATEEYWSGYEPFSQPHIHYSEPGAINRNIAKAKGDPVMAELLSVADNQPYFCNMADLESKGKVMAIPELVLMDCNDASMNVDVIVNNPSAIRRRLVYIVPTVKPGFRKPGTSRMDQAVSLASDIPKLDRWLFDVYTQEPVTNVISNTVYQLRGADIYELVTWLTDSYNTHISEQKARVALPLDIDISSYLRSACAVRPADKVKAESLVYVPSFVPFDWVIYYFPHFLALGDYLMWLVSLISLYLFLVVLWLWPQNFVYKAISVRACYQRINFVQDRVEFKWQFFRAVCGWKNLYTGLPPPSYHTQQFVLALSAVILGFKCYKGVSLFTEGNIVSSSNSEATEPEIDREIARIEEKSAAARPPPRPKRGNGIDWDSLPRSIPMPIDSPVQYNEPEKVYSAVQSNVRLVHIEGVRTIETHVTGLCADLALVNRHSINHPRADGTWEFTVRMSAEHKVGIFRCVVTESEFVPIEGDLFLVRLRGAKFKDIRSYLCADYYTPPPYGGKAMIDSCTVTVHQSGRIVAHDSNFGEVVVERPLSYPWREHASGKCGLPLVAQFSGGSGIVGFHVAGSSGELAFSQSIRKADVDRAIKSLEKGSCALSINSEGLLRLPSRVTRIGSVSERSPLNFEDVPGLNVYGGLEGYSVLKLGKSKLLSTPFVHYAERLTGISPFDASGAPLFGAPVFAAGLNKITGEYQGPYNHFVKKAGVLKKSLSPVTLAQTIDLVSEHLITSLRARGVTTLRPVTLEIAQNGDPCDFYMRAMKPSTSGGFPWPGAKKKFSRECCLDFKVDSYMPLFDVKEQVYEQCAAYERGEDALPLLGAQLKDEPRSLQKIRDRKTRVFCMSPYESTLVNRMFLMPFYSLMVEHGDIFRTAIGVNMHSTDVADICSNMASFHTFMEGDYGGFDTSMPYDIGLAANTIVWRVCENLGYDDYALNMVRGILSDNLYPTVVMRGDLFAAPALQPSGKYATAEDNSLRGLVLLVYYWISMCELHNLQPVDFWTVVTPLIYGDDVVVGVSPRARAFFNNNKYQEFCASVYGLEYTSALKTSVMEDFLTWDQCSFLKRNFVFREDLDQWVAPLDLASIMKSIVYYLPSKSVSKEEQLIDSCVSALRELFFHLAEEEYHLRRLAFADAVSDVFERKSSDILKVFPTFDTIRTQLYGSNAELLVECKVVICDPPLTVPQQNPLPWKIVFGGHYISCFPPPFLRFLLICVDPREVFWPLAPLSFALRFFLLFILSFFVPVLVVLALTWPVTIPWFWLHNFGLVRAIPEPPEWFRGFMILSIGSPIAEEWFKDGFYPLHALFALSELWVYGWSLARVPAFLMHLWGHGAPFHQRFLVHSVFNTCALIHFYQFPQFYLLPDAATQHPNLCPIGQSRQEIGPYSQWVKYEFTCLEDTPNVGNKHNGY